MLLSCCNYKKKDVFKILTRQLDRGLPVLLKKDYRHTTSVTGLLSELGWLPLSERRKHSRLTFSTRRLITFKSFLWITSQFHYGILEPPMKINLCHCQFVGLLMLLNIHFSSDHYRLELPPTGCSPLAVDSVFPWRSELGILLSLLIIMILRR